MPGRIVQGGTGTARRWYYPAFLLRGFHAGRLYIEKEEENLGKKNYTRWMFVLPAIIIVIALFIYPICSSIVYSFTNKNLIKPVFKFIGFKNYAEVLKDTGSGLRSLTP